MKENSKSIEVRVTFISKIIISFPIVFFSSATVLLMMRAAIWLIGSLFTIGALLFLISWIVPGILIILWHPNLAYAWLNGRNRLAFSDTPWELLSSKQKRSVYADSLITFFAVVAFIIWFISEQ